MALDREDIRTILELLEGLLSKSEKATYATDDPSGYYTEYVVDSEAVRANIKEMLDDLKYEDQSERKTNSSS